MGSTTLYSSNTRFKVQGSRFKVGRCWRPAPCRLLPCRRRRDIARNDEPASMSVFICATSYGIDVVVIAVIIVGCNYLLRIAAILPLCPLCPLCWNMTPPSALRRLPCSFRAFADRSPSHVRRHRSPTTCTGKKLTCCPTPRSTFAIFASKAGTSPQAPGIDEHAHDV
jgi:hypothetical protein